MTDATTHKHLRVATDGTAGPYIIVPVNQLAEVKRLLEANRIRHWIEENVVSLDGAPFTAVINLGRNGDAAAAQALLDTVR